MTDQDHKISRGIVDFAVSQGVSTIRLERLRNIRKTTRTSRKTQSHLHTWSFYRLAQFVEYKSRFEGIAVQYVDPAYTSQRCPACGQLNHAKDRQYECDCGYGTHRDRLGAINVLDAPMSSDKRKTA